MLRTLALLIAVALLAPPAAAQERWVGSWATSQQVPEERNALGPHDLDDATLRQTVHLSTSGARLRLRLSNAFGTTPLHIAAAHIARAAPGSDRIESASDTALRFSGQADVTIPAGAEYVSDPVAFPGTDIAVSLYFDKAPAQQTSHPGSRTTSYLLHGNHLSDAAARRSSITGSPSPASMFLRAEAPSPSSAIPSPTDAAPPPMAMTAGPMRWHSALPPPDWM